MKARAKELRVKVVPAVPGDARAMERLDGQLDRDDFRRMLRTRGVYGLLAVTPTYSIVGYAVYRLRVPVYVAGDLFSAGVCRLWRLGVRPKDRRSGVGGHIMAEVVRQAASLGVGVCVEAVAPEHDDAALAFLRKQGFRLQKFRRDYYPGDHGWQFCLDPKWWGFVPEGSAPAPGHEFGGEG